MPADLGILGLSSFFLTEIIIQHLSNQMEGSVRNLISLKNWLLFGQIDLPPLSNPIIFEYTVKKMTMNLPEHRGSEDE